MPEISQSPLESPLTAPRAAEAPALPQLTGSAPVLHPVVAVEGEHPQVCQHVVNGRVHLRGGDVLGTPAGTWRGWDGPTGMLPALPGSLGRGEGPGVEKGTALEGEKGVTWEVKKGEKGKEQEGQNGASLGRKKGGSPRGKGASLGENGPHQGKRKGSEPRMGEGSISGEHTPSSLCPWLPVLHKGAPGPSLLPGAGAFESQPGTCRGS